jgi:hypothetical protein
MTGLHRAIRQAQRRLWLKQILALAKWCMMAGLAVVLVLLLADRLTRFYAPLWGYLAIGAAALLAGPAWTLWHRPAEHEAAAALDSHLGLKDRLATALYAERLDQPLAKQVLADAETTAGRTRVKDALPLEADCGWWHPATLAALVALLAVVLPHAALFAGGAASQNQKDQQQRADASQQQIKNVRASVQDMQAKQEKEQTSDPGQLQKRLASLPQRDLSSSKAREQAQAEMSEIKDRLDQVEQAKKKQVQSMRSAMSKLDSKQSGPADRFENALRRGDYEAAKDALKKMAQKLENGDYSAKQKHQLKKQLNSLSKQLNKLSKQAKKRSQQAKQQTQKQLKQAGLNQKQINKLQKQGMNQQAVQKALQKQEMNKQQAKKMAKQMQKRQQQAKSGQSSSGACQGLGSSLGQMTSSMSQGGQGKQDQGKKGQGKQGQGGQSSQFKQGAFSGQQQLQQMSRMKQSMQQVQRAQSQAQQAMQRMAGGGGKKQGQGAGMNGGQKQGGSASRQAGTSPGGNPLSKKQQPLNAKRHASADIKRGKGRVIASWQQQGEMDRGESNVAFEKSVKGAQNRANQAVNEDRVPRRYHGSIKDYFNQLPDSAKQQGAPAAPR